LGRFPAKKDGGATNKGMWGASNTGTEDNWWFDHLHQSPEELKAAGTRYFKQPGGLSPEAENLENLPPYAVGNHQYYLDLAKGNSDVWNKQYIDAEWGFSIAGKPVISSFRPLRHISKTPLRYNPGLPLVAGFDPGLAGSALVFGQQDLHARLVVLGELVQENMGSERIISERLRPFMRRFFPDAQLIIAPDPASANRGQRDEIAVIQPFRDKYEVDLKDLNNRLPLRVDALDHFCNLDTDVGGGLLIDEQACPTVCRALKGGWRFSIDPKRDMVKGSEPEKNKWSHAGDATGYLARFFFRRSEKELRYGPLGSKPFTPPRKFGPNYFVR
jgi:hypothetical protein